jgi:DNA-directed RNA polymerase specialized sigma subunit
MEEKVLEMMHSTHVKEALKQLRKERKDTIERVRKTIKVRNRKIIAVKSKLAEKALTIPEIAAALGMEAADVLVIVMALRKYGEVVENTKIGDYFKYRLAVKTDLR